MNEKEFLDQYDDSKYVKPSVTADINIFSVFDEKHTNYRKLSNKKLKILLIKRGAHPYLGMYALPGGFVRQNETLEQAATRELVEETGVSCNFLEQIKTFSEPGRDPRRWVITCSFIALLDGSKYQVCGGDDAETAEWFEVCLNKKKSEGSSITWELKLQKDDITLSAMIRQDENMRYGDDNPKLTLLNPGNIAFDHALLITHAVFELRRLVNRTNIVFDLLPEVFTLSEIQQVYETILDKKLLAPAFRRRIADVVEETDQYQQTAGHRPSRLYRQRQRR